MTIEESLRGSLIPEHSKAFQRILQVYQRYISNDVLRPKYELLCFFHKLNAGLGMFGLISTAIATDLEQTNVFEVTTEVIILDLIGQLSTIALLVCLVLTTKVRYENDLEFADRFLGCGTEPMVGQPGFFHILETLNLYPLSTTRPPGYIYVRDLVFELIIFGVHVPVGTESTLVLHIFQDTKTVYTWRSLISVFMMIRLLLFIPVLIDWSGFADDSFRFLGEMGAYRVGLTFSVRALVSRHPLFVMGSILAINTITLSYGLRVAERAVDSRYDYLWNAIWVTVVTMTTVGYGDFVPETHMGRFFAMIACFSNLFLSAVMVVTVADSATFTASERRTYEAGTRLILKKQMKGQAALLIQATWACFRTTLSVPQLREYRSKKKSKREPTGAVAKLTESEMLASLRISGVSVPSLPRGGSLAARMHLLKRLLEWKILRSQLSALEGLSTDPKVQTDTLFVSRHLDSLQDLVRDMLSLVQKLMVPWTFLSPFRYEVLDAENRLPLDSNATIASPSEAVPTADAGESYCGSFRNRHTSSDKYTATAAAVELYEDRSSAVPNGRHEVSSNQCRKFVGQCSPSFFSEENEDIVIPQLSPIAMVADGMEKLVIRAMEAEMLVKYFKENEPLMQTKDLKLKRLLQWHTEREGIVLYQALVASVENVASKIATTTAMRVLHLEQKMALYSDHYPKETTDLDVVEVSEGSISDCDRLKEVPRSAKSKEETSAFTIDMEGAVPLENNTIGSKTRTREPKKRRRRNRSRSRSKSRSRGVKGGETDVVDRHGVHIKKHPRDEEEGT